MRNLFDLTGKVALVTGAGTEDRPVRLTEDYGRWLSARLDGSWLPIRAQVRASVALGLLDPDDIAAQADVPTAMIAAAFGLDLDV